MTSSGTTVDPATITNSACVPAAATSIFKATCGLDLRPVELDAELNEVVVAVISLMGSVEWAVFLGLPKPTAVALAAKFAGFEIPFESSDMADAIGELTNIFAGEVKAQLDRKGVKAEISLPSVLRGDNLHLVIPRDTPLIKTCFDSAVGKIVVGLVVGKKSSLASL